MSIRFKSFRGFGRPPGALDASPVDKGRSCISDSFSSSYLFSLSTVPSCRTHSDSLPTGVLKLLFHYNPFGKAVKMIF